MDTQAKKISPVHYIVVVAFCLFFRFVPGFAGITPYGMGILGCFIGAIYGWIFIDMLWPSLVGLLGMGLTVGMTQMMAASFGSVTVVALILCMGVVGVAMANGAFTWLVNKMLGSKSMQGKPWVIIEGVFLIAFCVGSFNPIIMMIIFGAFLTTMFKACGVQFNDKLAIYMYLGSAFALMMGQILFPFMGTGLTLLYAYMAMSPGATLSIVPYMIFMILMGVCMTIAYTLLMKFVCRVNVQPLADYCPDCADIKATKDQKMGLILFVLFILVNVLGALPIPVVSKFISQFGLFGYCVVFSCVVALIPSENGGPLGNLEQLFHMCNWGQVTMVGFIMVMSTYINSADAGITTAMAQLFTPFMSMSPYVFICVMMLIGVVLTNIANNMIVVVMIMPFLINFGAQVGMSPTAMVMLLFMMAQFALATPAASPVTAVAMTQEMADPKEMTKKALVIVPILAVIGLVIGLPLSQGVMALLG